MTAKTVKEIEDQIRALLCEGEQLADKTGEILIYMPLTVSNVIFRLLAKNTKNMTGFAMNMVLMKVKVSGLTLLCLANESWR